MELVKCDLALTSAAPSVVTTDVYNLGSWFTGQTTNTNNEVKVTYGPLGSAITRVLAAAETGSFNFSTTIPGIVNGDFITVTMQDTRDTAGCAPSIQVQYRACILAFSTRVLNAAQRSNIKNYFTGTGPTTQYYFKPYTTGAATNRTWGLLTPARTLGTPQAQLDALYPITASYDVNSWPTDQSTNSYWIKIHPGSGVGFDEDFRYTYIMTQVPVVNFLFEITYQYAIAEGDDQRVNIVTFEDSNIPETLWYRSAIEKAIGRDEPTFSLLQPAPRSGQYYQALTAFQFRAVNSSGCIVDTPIISPDVTNLPQPAARQLILQYINSGDWTYNPRTGLATAPICYIATSVSTGDPSLTTIFINNAEVESLVTNPNQLTPVDYMLENEIEIFADVNMTTYAPSGEYGIGTLNTSTNIAGQRRFGYWNSITATWHTGYCGF